MAQNVQNGPSERLMGRRRHQPPPNQFEALLAEPVTLGGTMAAVPTATHPKCGKTFPGGDSAGHCSACCETFIGKASFDAHRVGEHGVDRRCEVKPYTSYRKEYPHTIVYGHWEDERGFWRYGRKLTKDESAKIFGNRQEETK